MAAYVLTVGVRCVGCLSSHACGACIGTCGALSESHLPAVYVYVYVYAYVNAYAYPYAHVYAR